MRITINTLSVSDENEGIRTMLAGLVPALVRAEPRSRFRLICNAANAGIFTAIAGQVDMVLIGQRRRRPLARIVHDQVTVPWIVRRGTDVLLTPSTVGSLVTTVPQVVVVVAHLALPSVRAQAEGTSLSPFHRVYYGPVMRLSHRRAEAVVAISGFLADRLVADTGVSPQKVSAIPLGVDLTSAPMTVPGGDHPYVLFVSTLYPYKNAESLVRAVVLARPRLPGLTAVIVGRDPDGRQAPALQHLMVDLGVQDAVRLTGKVGAEELETLYGGASALVFPSRAEGFGFPALEAMARGVPVIASDRTSLPEVLGGAGVLVDPDRPTALADAIVDVVGDPQRRAELVAAGRERAAQLSWDETARAFVEVFRSLVA